MRLANQPEAGRRSKPFYPCLDFRALRAPTASMEFVMSTEFMIPMKFMIPMEFMIQTEFMTSIEFMM